MTKCVRYGINRTVFHHLGKESVPRESLGERDRHTKGSFFINVCGADTDLLPVLVGQSTHTLSKLFGTLEESFAPLPAGIRSLFRVDVGPHHAHVRRVAALSDLEQSQTTLYFFVGDGEPEPPSVAAVPLSDIAASDLPGAVKARLAPQLQRGPKKGRVSEPSGPQEYPPTPQVTPQDSTDATPARAPSEPSLGHPRHISPVPPVVLAQTTVPSSFPGGDTRAPVGHVSAIAAPASLPATTLEMVPEVAGADVLLPGAPFISADTEGPLDLVSQAWEGQAAVEAGEGQTPVRAQAQGGRGIGIAGAESEQVVGEELGLPPPPQPEVYGEPIPEAYYEPGVDEGVGPSGFGEAPVSPSYVGFAKYRTPAPAGAPAAEDGGSEAESEGGRPGALGSGFYVPLPNEEIEVGVGGGDLGFDQSQARSEEGTELQHMSQRGLAVLTQPEEAEGDEQRPWGLAPVMTDTGTMVPVPLPPGGTLGGTIAEGPEQLSSAAYSLSEGLRRSQSEAERSAELDIEQMVRDAVKEASAGTSPQGMIGQAQGLGPGLGPPAAAPLRRLTSEGSAISFGGGPQGGGFGGFPRPASYPRNVGAGAGGGPAGPGGVREPAPGPGLEPFFSGPPAPSGASLPPAAPSEAGFQFAPPAVPEPSLPQGYVLVGGGGGGEFSRDQVGQAQTGPGLFSESFDAFSGASMATAGGSLLAQPGSATAGGARERRRRATGPGILLEGLAASGIVPADMVEREGIEVPGTPGGAGAGPAPLPFYSLPATPMVPSRGAAVLPEPSMSHVSSAVAAFVAEQRGAPGAGGWAPGAAGGGQGRGLRAGVPLSDVSEGGIAISSAEAKSSETSGQVSSSPSRGEIHMGAPGLGFGPGQAPLASQQAQAALPTTAAEAEPGLITGREQFPVLQTAPAPLAPAPQIDIMNSVDFEAGGRTGAVVREAAEGALPREDLLPGSRAIVAAHGEGGAAHQISHLNGLSDINRSPARVVEQAFHPIAAGAVGTEGLARLQGVVQGGAQADVGPLQAELLGLGGAAAPPSRTAAQLPPKLASEGEIFEPSLAPGQEDEGKGLLQGGVGLGGAPDVTGGELSDSASLPGAAAASLPLPTVKTPQLAPISVQQEPASGLASSQKQNTTMLFAELAPESFLPPNVSNLPPAPAMPGNAGTEEETRLATIQGAIPPPEAQAGVSDTAGLGVGRDSSLREPLLGAEGGQDVSEGGLGSPGREIGGTPSDLALELEAADNNVYLPASPPQPREPLGLPPPFESANQPVGGDINEFEAGEGQRYREPSFDMDRPLASYPLSGLEAEEGGQATPPRGATAAYGQPGLGLGRVGAEVFYHGGSVPAAHLSGMASRGASPSAARHAAILFRDSPKVASMVLESLSPAILRTEKDLISDAMSGPGHPRPAEPSDREVEEIAVETMLEDLEEQRELEGALAPPLSPGKSSGLPREAPVPPRPTLGATTPYLSMSGLSSASIPGGASGTGTLAPAPTPQAAQYSEPEFSPVAPTPPPADARPVTPRSAPPVDDVPTEGRTGAGLEGGFMGVGAAGTAGAAGDAGDAGAGLAPRTPRIPAILLQWHKGESGEVSPPPLSAPRRHLAADEFASPTPAAQASSLPLEQGSPGSGPEPSLGPGSPESLSDFASPPAEPSLTTDVLTLSLASRPLEGKSPGVAESMEGSQHVPTPIPVPSPEAAGAKSSILLKTLSGKHPLNVDPLGPLPTLAPSMAVDMASMQVLAPSSGPGGASTAAKEASAHESDFGEGASIARGISTASIAGSLPHNPSELTTPAVSKTASFSGSAGGPVGLKGQRGTLEPAPELPTESKLPSVQVSGAGAGPGASVGGAPQPAASPPVDPNASRSVLIHEEHKRAHKDTVPAGGPAPEQLGAGGVKKGKKKGGFVRKFFAKLGKKKTGDA